MKLRNKKTGEIISSKELLTNEFLIDLFSKDFNYFNSKINKIQEEWEDYEEPKTAWFIDPQGDIQEWRNAECDDWSKEKAIGNYFDTQEEAEKAVEKLKAWKRLKDKGIRFFNNKIIGEYGNVSYTLTYPVTTIEEKQLDLLFGGEE